MVRSNQGNHTPHPQNKENHFLVSDLCQVLRGYLTEREVSGVYQAYLFGADAHLNQKRRSGEPYIYHPVEVARTMADLQLDAVTISAGLLHDVIEDTSVTKEQLEKEFGDEVAGVVDGVSKLEGLSFESREAKQAKNFQKMILAVAKDVRVILVKLADRLHNMRTIEHMPSAKQKMIARETLEIYAPLAHRIGIERLHVELEELAFKTLYPLRYAILKKEIERHAGKRDKQFEAICEKIRLHFEKAGFDCQIRGRKKHLYSIYHKMKAKQLPLSKVADIFAFRLIVNSVDDCYRALGVMHNFAKPVPGRFKDYIALPKANGYQSLHTVLFGYQGMTMEVQIRTHEMDRIAEAGIASHPLYKADDDNAMPGTVATHEWLKSLSALSPDAGDAVGFMESLKAELRPEEVYVFTPEGRIVSLPAKATLLDFAFAVHTDLGLSAKTGLVNHRPRPLSTVLRSGQTVEVLTSKDVCPGPAWLSFTVTAKARNAIHHYLKNIRQDEAVKLGKRLLESALDKHNMSVDKVKPAYLRQLIRLAGERDLAGLFYQIGIGNQIPQLIAARLLEPDKDGELLTLTIDQSSGIKNAHGIVITYAKCCYPLPGDPIVAVVSPGRGLVVHRDACQNVHSAAKAESDIIHLQWSDDLPQHEEYSAAIRAVTPHKKGALALIASEIARMGSNIEHISFEEQSVDVAAINFVIGVKSKKVLNNIMRGITKNVANTEVYRVGLKADSAH